MNNKVRILDPLTINKIAAGEVVENAASVVKELIENSLDAGAKKIVIEIVSGGRELISISDDGYGMNYQDALLCVERHATSKISDIDDLWSLQSFGFRGEALSSINAVSDFRLFTHSQEENEGSFVFAEGGKIQSHGKIDGIKGTKIEVRSLFYNVPVRRKFQKSTNSDEQQIAKIVSTMALGHPDIHFELYFDGKKEHFFQVHKDEKLKNRIGDVLGRNILEKLKKVCFTSSNWTIEGFIGSPEISKSNRMSQYLFVNKRSIGSLALSFGVKDGFGSTIDTSRHPLFILFLQGPEDQIDVNVHPQKKEIRFLQEEVLKKACSKATSEALFSLPTQTEESVKREYPPQNFTWSHPILPLDIIPSEVAKVPTLFEVERSYKILSLVWNYAIVEFSATCPLEELIGKTYLVDLKRASKRLTYESFSRSDTHESEILLIPKCIELPPQEFVHIQSLLKTLSKWGFIIREFAKTTFLIEGVPKGFEDVDCDVLFSDLCTEELTLQTIVTKSSLKLPVSPEMAEQLVSRLLATDNPFFDPSGGKILTPFCAHDLEKFFTL